MYEQFHVYDFSAYATDKNNINTDKSGLIQRHICDLVKVSVDYAKNDKKGLRQEKFVHTIALPQVNYALIISGMTMTNKKEYIIKVRALDRVAKTFDNRINIKYLDALLNESNIKWWQNTSCRSDADNILTKQQYTTLINALGNERHLIEQLGDKYNAEDMVGLQSSYGDFIAGNITSAFWPNMRYNKLIYENKLQVHYPSLPDGDYKRFATYGQNYCIAPVEIIDETKIMDANAITIDSPLIYVSLEHGKPMINGDPIPNYDKYVTQTSIKDDFKNIQNEQTRHKNIDMNIPVVKQKIQDNSFEK